MKKALITGVTGQDGSYLVELLLDKGYEVHGIVRPSSVFNRERIDSIYLNPQFKNTRFALHYGDLIDSSNLNRIVEKVAPDEIYNLGAQSHVHVSFELPEYTTEVNGIGTLRLLDAIKEVGIKTKFYQASTSELYGNTTESPQNEKTPFLPCSPYAASKLLAHRMTINYREAYNLYACNGILFNHESPRRGKSFVTRKITITLARIKKGKAEKLSLGNINAERDWGYVKDYVEGMWMMLQQEAPDDYVLATGEAHTVREFCEKAFKYAGYNIAWEGKGVDEKGVDRKTGKVLIDIDPLYFRPTDVNALMGDATKAGTKLGWRPKVRFEELIRIMVDYDMDHE